MGDCLRNLASVALVGITAATPMVVGGVVGYNRQDAPGLQGGTALEGMLLGVLATPALFVPLVGLEMLAGRIGKEAYNKARDIVLYVRDNKPSFQR